VLNYEAPSLINDNQIDRYGLELRYTLPNGVVLRSQSGYQDHYFRTSAENSNDAFNDSIQYTQVGPGDRNYYQEINAISPDTGRLTWVAGAASFYRNTPVYLGSNRLSLPPAGPLNSGPSPETALDIVSVTRSVGAFGQLSYRLLDTLQLQAGVRENWDNNFNGGAISVIGPFGPLAVIPNTGQFKSSTPTAKVGLNWSPVADQFVYAFGARGYKSGGVNVATGLPFEDEHVNDYEAGINSRFLDGHLQTRLGAYYMVYEGMQEDIFNAKAGYMDEVVNLANSTIKGLELSIQSRFGGLGVNLNVAYNNSRLGAVSSPNALIDGGVVASYRLPPEVQAVPALFPASVFNYAPYVENISGEQNPYSPKLTANASVDYAILVGPGTIRPVVSFSHTDKQFASLFQNDNFYMMPARNIWDVSGSYEEGSWLTQVYAKNVTNSVYVSGYSGNTEYYGAPRQIGLRVRKSF
jgi:iron complex outermembrane receptor protein